LRAHIRREKRLSFWRLTNHRNILPGLIRPKQLLPDTLKVRGVRDNRPPIVLGGPKFQHLKILVDFLISAHPDGLSDFVPLIILVSPLAALDVGAALRLAPAGDISGGEDPLLSGMAGGTFS